MSKEKTPIARLNEWCAKSERPEIKPCFEEVDKEGQSHDPVFTFKCTVGKHSAKAKGSSKKLAEHEAANKVLEEMETCKCGQCIIQKPKGPTSSTPLRTPQAGGACHDSNTNGNLQDIYQEITVNVTVKLNCHAGKLKDVAKEQAVKAMVQQVKAGAVEKKSKQILVSPEKLPEEQEKTYVAQLNELCQKLQDVHLKMTPHYEEIDVKGKDHVPEHVMKCTVGTHSAEGRGTTKMDAKHESAKKVYRKLSAESAKYDESTHLDANFRLKAMVQQVEAGAWGVEKKSKQILVSPEKLHEELEKTYVAQLNELCQKLEDVHLKMTPHYEEIDVKGKDHVPEHIMKCTVGTHSAEGRGKTKMDAKHDAAKKVYRKLSAQSAKCDKSMYLEANIGLEVKAKVMNEFQSSCHVPDTSDNPVGELQELAAQELKCEPPTYDFTDANLVCNLKLDDLSVQESGETKAIAKRKAAQVMLKKIRTRTTSTTPEKPDELQSILSSFLDNEVAICSKGRDKVSRVSCEVASLLKEKLAKKATLFHFPKVLEAIGSFSDGTFIQHKGDCDFLLHMELSGTTELTIDHQGDGYYRVNVKSQSLSMESSMSKLTVRVDEKKYLSPLKVHASLLSAVQNIGGVLNNIDGVSVKHTSQQAGPALKFKVTYNSYDGSDDCELSFDMDIVPCFTVQGKQLVGKRHPNQKPLHKTTKADRNDPSHLDLLWRQGLSTKERDRIAGLDQVYGACPKNVYRLVKYLRYHQSQFRQFSSFIYKTVFLYLLDEHEYPGQWRQQMLANRFLDFMKKLEDFFSKGVLNHYFLQEVEKIRRNLLMPKYEQDQIDGFCSFLHHRNQKGQEAWVSVFNALRIAEK